jgi:hypothetical protein
VEGQPVRLALSRTCTAAALASFAVLATIAPRLGRRLLLVRLLRLEPGVVVVVVVVLHASHRARRRRRARPLLGRRARVQRGRVRRCDLSVPLHVLEFDRPRLAEEAEVSAQPQRDGDAHRADGAPARRVDAQAVSREGALHDVATQHEVAHVHNTVAAIALLALVLELV